MPCCGDKRTAFVLQTNGPTRPSTVAVEPQRSPAAPSHREQTYATRQRPPFGSVAIRYLANPSILVRGPSTRIEYRFSAAHPVQQVARADVEALLASGYFTRDS